MLQCVINVSAGRDVDLLADLAARARPALLDVHRDRDHNRAVFTLAGEEVEAATRRLAREVVARVDIGAHRGAHPRLGALDVVPWVHLNGDPRHRLRDGDLSVAVAARDRFAVWAGTRLDLPCFVYGPIRLSPGERSLPDLRREAWRTLTPDTGPPHPHPTAGAACVGARPLLIAYNLWLAGSDLATARRVARLVRSPRLRTLGLQVGDEVQVSCNLIDPWTVGPAAAFDAVASLAEVGRAELVGLLPLGVLETIPSSRWALLDLDASRTIEARLERAGLDGGRFGSEKPPVDGDLST
jgi:glutamate formiminotransferase / 5-formyltetrahydrofolate cyclo-ligase